MAAVPPIASHSFDFMKWYSLLVACPRNSILDCIHLVLPGFSPIQRRSQYILFFAILCRACNSSHLHIGVFLMKKKDCVIGCLSFCEWLSKLQPPNIFSSNYFWFPLKILAFYCKKNRFHSLFLDNTRMIWIDIDFINSIYTLFYSIYVMHCFHIFQFEDGTVRKRMVVATHLQRNVNLRKKKFLPIVL